MRLKKTIMLQLSFIITLLSFLTACGSNSGSGIGYYQFYNASESSPSMYLTIDDTTYSSVSYPKSTSFIEASTGSQDIELQWQDGDESYQSVYSDTLTTSEDQVQLLIATGDISAPDILNFQYPYENPDDTDEIFLLRFINLHDLSGGVDVYYSADDETFNEAVLIGEYAQNEMSESIELPYQLSYKFYITASGSDEVLYESDSIYFGYSSQYVFTIRANNGPGDSPFTLDKLSQSNSVVNYPDTESATEFRVYNGITTDDLLANYHNNINVQLNGISSSLTLNNLTKGSVSETLTLPFGDYSLDLTDPDSDQIITTNKLVTLPANSDKTLFFYSSIVTEADDGNDATVETTSAFINTLTVSNSNRVSYYDHQINVINLIEDYSGVNVYFVRSNETISDAYYAAYTSRANPITMTLLNNTYQVYIVSKEDDSDFILATQSITLDESSGDLFMVLEREDTAASGFSIHFINQND